MVLVVGILKCCGGTGRRYDVTADRRLTYDHATMFLEASSALTRPLKLDELTRELEDYELMLDALSYGNGH
jgi:hypothetical protein